MVQILNFNIICFYFIFFFGGGRGQKDEYFCWGDEGEGKGMMKLWIFLGVTAKLDYFGIYF